MSLLNPQVIRDLKLADHGLRIVERPFSNFLPLHDGRSFQHGGDTQQALAEIARFSPRDAERLPAYNARLERLADQLRQWVLRTPPNLGGPWVMEGWRDMVAGAQLLLQMGRLPRDGQRDLVDVFTKSAGDWLDSWFESDVLKAALGWDLIVGNYASPYAAGSAYVLLHHCFGEVNGKPGRWGHAMGGMGAITQAMAAEAHARSVDISTDTPVARVIVEGGRSVGVELASGESIAARAVVSNVNPKLLYQRLIDRDQLPTEFNEAIARYKCGSGTFRVNVALAELPDFSARPGTNPQPHHASGILFAPSLQAMDRAWHDAVAHGHARVPIVEMLVPSVVDDTLAPPGRHVASLFCQQFAPAADWANLKIFSGRSDFQRRRFVLPEFSPLAAWLPRLVAGRSRSRVRIGRRRHLPRPVVARSNIFDAAFARIRALSRSAGGPVPLWLGCAPGRRRYRCARSQRGA